MIAAYSLEVFDLLRGNFTPTVFYCARAAPESRIGCPKADAAGFDGTLISRFRPPGGCVSAFKLPRANATNFIFHLLANAVSLVRASKNHV